MKTLLVITLSLFILSCSNNGEMDTAKPEGKLDTEVIKSNNTLQDDKGGNKKFAEITFDSQEFDFGVIHEGDVVEYDFEFTNTGNVPLIISNTKASCGCTVASFPKEPIAPGESAKISARFDSTGKPSGPQERHVYITANTEPNQTQVALKGEII